MKSRLLAKVAQAMGGESRAVDPDAVVSGAAIDSRAVQNGDLFFALAGQNAHGIEFCSDALRRGAAAVVTDKAHPSAAPCILVEDVAQSLTRLAEHVRAEEVCTLPAAAITGSVGKTTVCGYAAALLGGAGIAHRPPRSFNNALGVPLTILNAPANCRFLILEVGTNAPGEVLALAHSARPRVACITAITPAHLLGLGTLEGVAAEKLSVLAALPEGGEAWIPADGAANFAESIPSCRARVRTFGPGGDLELSPGAVPGEWRLEIEGATRGHLREWHAPFPHSPRNLEAALAVGLAFGIATSILLDRVDSLALPSLRGECETHGGVDLLLDCYNSSPAALESSIARLEREPARGRRICVIGTMEELGAEEQEWHRRLGERLAAPRLDAVYLLGRGREWYLAGLRGRGACGELLADDDDSARRLTEFLRPGDRVLFKASRRDALERFAARVARLLDGDGSPAGRERGGKSQDWKVAASPQQGVNAVRGG